MMVVGTEPKSTIKYRNVQSLIDSHFIYSGRISGQRYEWVRAGAIVSVEESDVPYLLEKRLGGSLCCGNRDGNRIFELVGD